MIDKTPSADVMRGWVKSHRDKATPIQQFDIGIDANGQWFHEGSLIQKEKLVKLFASILTRLEDGTFVLLPLPKLARLPLKTPRLLLQKWI